MAPEEYATVRSHLAEFVGLKLLEVTQHDQEYFQEHGIGFVDLMFEGGNILRIWSMRGDEPLMTINPDGDTPEEIGRGEF